MRTGLATAVAVVATLAACAAPALATDDGNTYNNEFSPFNADISNCYRTVGWTGIAAFGFDGTYMPFGLNAHNDPCPPSSAGEPRVRVLRLQSLTVGGRTTYVNRGGGAAVGSGSQPTVHISASDLRDPVSLLSFATRNGNGRGAPGCTYPIYTYPAGVAGMPGNMYYKTPAEGGGPGSEWSNYADPGRRYGTDYSYALWNLPRKGTAAHTSYLQRGAGIVMATLKSHTRWLACDVSHEIVDSYDGAGNWNGFVEFAYGQVTNGTETLRGWLMVGYSYMNQPEVYAFSWT